MNVSQPRKYMTNTRKTKNKTNINLIVNIIKLNQDLRVLTSILYMIYTPSMKKYNISNVWIILMGMNNQSYGVSKEKL